MPPLSARTIAAIHEMFSPESQQEAAEILTSYGEHPYQREVERVRACLLQISHGEIERLRKYVQSDYRDLIVFADIDRKRRGQTE